MSHSTAVSRGATRLVCRAHSFWVTIDPNDSKTLLALSNASNNITGGVYRSTDGGLNLDTEFRNYRRFRRAAEHRLQPDAPGR